jgi:hypothetical protein
VTKTYRMSSNNAVNGNESDNTYSIPQNAQDVFQNGILKNSLIQPKLPQDFSECASKIEFVGTDKPSIPMNWRVAESMSALKGFEASMINLLLKRKYGVEPQKVVINT